MKIRTKIIIGISFMFLQLLVLGSFSVYHAYTLAEMGKSLFADNSRSIQYCENIIRAVDAYRGYDLSGKGSTAKRSRADFNRLLKVIEENLVLEEKNITEPGEREIVLSVRADVNVLKNDRTMSEKRVSGILNKLADDIHKISYLNISAIERKNTAINEYEMRYYIYLSIIATIFVLVSFSFLFNFPEFAVTPSLKFSTTDVKQINKKVNKK
jgi:two-component system, NtrC family, sensor histidine kinase KinB